VPLGFGIDGPLWTMSLEVTFYVILPFIAAWYFRRPLAGLVVAAAITVVWHEALIHWPTTLTSAAYTQFPFFAFSFGAGMTGAWAYVRLRERYRPEQLARHVGWVQLLSLVSLLVFCYLVVSHHGRSFLGDEAARRSPVIALGFTGSLATLMVATALGPMRWQRPFAHPFARWLGDISYGMYLIHYVIIVYAGHLLFNSSADVSGSIHPGSGSFATFVGLAAVVLPLTVLYGYVSGHYLEQPIRRWAQRFGRRHGERGASARVAATGRAGG
jgi:peptidoglycan/LPS O-acetylase OafA/YrhL